LLDISQETFGIDRTVENKRRNQPRARDARNYFFSVSACTSGYPASVHKDQSPEI